MSSMTAKCPMYYYGRDKVIKCGQRAQERHDFATR